MSSHNRYLEMSCLKLRRNLRGKLYIVQFVLNTPPPLINTPTLVKDQLSNVDFWIFQNSPTRVDFSFDALTPSPHPPWLRAKFSTGGGIQNELHGIVNYHAFYYFFRIFKLNRKICIPKSLQKHFLNNYITVFCEDGILLPQ